MKNTDWKKVFSWNIGGFLGLGVFLYIMSFLLLQGEILPFSISAVQLLMNQWLRHWHILVVLALPMYVAFLLILAAILGFICGSALQAIIGIFFYQKRSE